MLSSFPYLHVPYIIIQMFFFYSIDKKKTVSAVLSSKYILCSKEEMQTALELHEGEYNFHILVNYSLKLVSQLPTR